MSVGLINIIRLLVDIYATVLLVRLLLQLVQADFFNPLSQTIFKVTAPIVEPLHKNISNHWTIQYRNISGRYFDQVVFLSDYHES